MPYFPVPDFPKGREGEMEYYSGPPQEDAGPVAAEAKSLAGTGTVMGSLGVAHLEFVAGVLPLEAAGSVLVDSREEASDTKAPAEVPAA